MSIFFAAPIDRYPDYDKVTTTPTVSTTAAGFPGSNLLTYDPTQVWKATDTVPSIVWDFGAQKTFDVVSLIYTNLSDAAIWTLQVSNDNTNWTTLVNGVPALAHVISGQTTQNKKNMLRRNHTLYNSATPRTFRYLRIYLDTQTTGLFPSVGRLFVGKKWTPATGWQYGSEFNFQDPSTRERTPRGALILDPQPVLPVATVKMDFLSKTEMMDFVYEFNYWIGAGREFLACLDVEDTKYLQKNTLYCTIAEGRRISFDSYNNHSTAWILESIAA